MLIADIMMSKLPLSWEKREAIFPINLCLCRTLGRPGADTSFGLFKEFRNLDLHRNTSRQIQMPSKTQIHRKIRIKCHRKHKRTLTGKVNLGKKTFQINFSKFPDFCRILLDRLPRICDSFCSCSSVTTKEARLKVGYKSRQSGEQITFSLADKYDQVQH